jgi:hypothetical protein
MIMPFGVINGPPTFQRAVSKTFREYLDKFVKTFLDDFIVYSDMENFAFIIATITKLMRKTKPFIWTTKC